MGVFDIGEYAGPAFDALGGGGDSFNLSGLGGGDWFGGGGQFNLQGNLPQWDAGMQFDPQSGWPGGVDFSQWTAGGPTTPGGGLDLSGLYGSASDAIKKYGGDLMGLGGVGKDIFGFVQGIEHNKQMGDYQKKLDAYYKAQADYIKQKQAYEADFWNQWNTEREEFGGAQEEFQGQLGAAQEQVNEVFGGFMDASKKYLAQSQEMLVPAIEALTKGQVPEGLEPLLDQVRQRATATGMQSLISGGMSPEAAAAAVQPVVDQQVQAMLQALGKELSTQGLMAGELGMKGLQGAGMMPQIGGQLAQIGLGAVGQEFQAMSQVLARILGGGTLGPPPAPVA